MKTKSPGSSPKFVAGAAIGFVLLLLACYPQSANAQTNTFPSSGNVGVGTTTPSYPLEVNSNQNTFVDLVVLNNPSSGANAQASFGFFEGAILKAKIAVNSSSGSNPYYGGTNAFQFFNMQNAPVVFGTNGAERVRIDGAGKVGIGTASPKAKVDIKQPEDTFLGGIHLRRSTTNDTWAIATGSDNNLYMGYATDASGADAYTDFTVYPLVLTTTNRIGIGTLNPGYKLDVAGVISSSTGGFRFPDGTVQLTAAGSGPVTSVFGRTGAVVAATNDYTWAQINKTTSSLFDLQTRSAGDLSSGTLPDARFPASLPAVSGANLTSLNASNLTNGTVAPARLGNGAANTTTFLRGDNTWAVPSGEGSSPWATDGANVFFNTGKVGIGTAAPQRTLHIVHQSDAGPGTITIDEYAAAPDIRFRRAQGTIANPSATTFNNAIGAITAAGYDGTQFTTFRGLVSINASENWTNTAQGTFIAFYNTAAGGTTTTEKMRINPNGNVGIGTTSPGQRLSVAGTVESTSGGFKFPDGSVQATAAGGAQSIFKDIANGSGTTQFSASSINDSLRFEGTGGTSVSFDANNKKVIINSTEGGGNGTITGVTAGAGLAGGGTTGAVTLAVNYGSSVGTAVEGNKSIAINTSDGIAGGTTLTLGTGGSLNLTNTDKGSSQSIFKNVANVAGTTQFSAASNNDAVRFAGTGGTTVSFDTGTKKITVDSSGITSSQWTTSGNNINYAPAGNVGIGTGAPTEKLHVTGNGKITGNLTVDGNINAKYQDVAEWVPATNSLPVGTVVTLDPTRSNHVEASSKAYDTRVAGVISEQPGITLGERGDNKVLVATTGRVRLKVDASSGPIQVGDLLVTSDIPGIAMKSQPLNLGGIQLHRPGTLVGKALEPLTKGRGEILVLLSLQ